MQEMQQTCVRSLGQEDPLEEGMATHSSVLVWKIPWTEALWLHRHLPYVRCHFPLTAFQNFILMLGFQELNYDMPRGLQFWFFFSYPTWNSLRLLDL